MRIGIYAPNMTIGPPTGVERYVSELVAALARSGTQHEFVLLSDGDETPAAPRWSRVPLSGMGWIRRLHFDHRKLAPTAREQKLDLLHCTKSFIPAGLDCPAVMTVYDVIFLKYRRFYPAWWRWYWTRSLERSVERATAILSISDATARDLESEIPSARGKVRVIPLGVDLQRFGAENGTPESPPYFLYVGNLTVRKNVSVLLDAFERLAARAAFRLVVVGGREYGAGPVLARLRGDRIRYEARVPDDELRRLYRGATAFVYPSQYEGFGLPVLEAMAGGCPVIATTGGALPEVVGDAGLLVDPGRVESLADAMDRVARDPELRARLARAGRERAARFTWDDTARGTLEAYERAVLNEAPART